MILENEIYCGRTYYNKTRKVGKKTVKQPKENWTPIDVPELTFVDLETWEVAQKRFERNCQLAKRNVKHKYLLSGFFRCGSCGSASIGSTGKRRYRFYRCVTAWRVDRNDCHIQNKTISANIAENKAWEWFAGLLETDEKLSKGLRAMQERSEAEPGPKRKRLEAVKSLIVKADAKIKRLINNLGDEEAEAVAAALSVEVKSTAQHKRALEDERGKIERELEQVTISPDAEAKIREFATRVRKKRQLFDLFDFQATFIVDDRGRWMDVKCRLKPEGDAIMFHPSGGNERQD